MTDLKRLAARLHARVDWQRMPVEISSESYERMLCEIVLDAIEYLFVKTGRYNRFSRADVALDEQGLPESIPGYTLPLDEEQFVLLYAQMIFFQKIRTDVNNIVGYTTDALSVTNADKPYQYLTGTINELRAELRTIFYAMTRHALL